MNRREILNQLGFETDNTDTSKQVEARINELEACGLDNDKVCADLIASELTDGKLTKRPGKLPCELFDKVNLMCRVYMDRMARIELVYDSDIDIKAFKTAVIGLLEKAPVFRSKVVRSPIAPYWKPTPYKIDEVVTVSDKEDFSADKNAFFAQEIPTNSNVQLLIRLYRHSGKTSVCYLVNHMCVDGGGFFAFIHDICRNYTSFINEGKSPIDYRQGPRGFEEVYADMDKETKKKAKSLISNIASKVKSEFPYTARSKDDKPILAHRKINAEIFGTALKSAKALGCSGNDLLLAAYMTAFRKLSGLEADKPVNVTTAIDLRRHMKNPQRIGYTNHVSFFNCTVSEVGSSVKQTIKAVNEACKPIKKDKFIGLSGLPLLNIAYKSMVYAQAETIIKLFYSNPSLSVSNVGAVNPSAYVLGDSEPVDLYASGATKHKPCAVMTVGSLNGVLSLAISFFGNDKDTEIIENFFDEFEIALKEIAQ